MTRFLGPELLVDAVIFKLQSEMPSRVAQINEEKDDGIAIVAPDPARYFTSAKRQIPPPGPAVLVMDGKMSLDSRGEGPHSLSTVTALGIYVLEEDADETILARKLWRQARAVVESLWDGDPKEQLLTADGALAGWKILPTGTVPGPAFEPEGGGPSLRQFYLTTFTVSRLED